MYKGYVILYLLATVTANGTEKKSFTIVIDTTVSMRDEIDILKANLQSVVIDTNLADIANYILVPFDDPGFGPPLIMSKADRLVELMNIVEVGGGSDCPESSMPAIEQALTVSKPNSFIFVFTDGYANDDSKLSSIKRLCRSTHSQVIIFLSGKCVATGTRAVVGTIDAYFDVAKSCSGSVLQFELSNYRQVFKFMKELIKTDWTEIQAHEEFIGPKLFTFPVDSYTKDFIVAVSGEYASLEITDEYGRSPTVEKIVDTRQSQVVRIVRPDIGEYKANILSQGPTITTFYRRRELKFQFGFSPKLPRSMKETSRLPIPGSSSYICVAVAEISIELNSIHIKFDGRDVKAINVEIVDQSKGLYAAKEYFEPGKAFRITIYGRDSSSYQVIKGTTGTLVPQTQVLRPQEQKPRITMIEPKEALVDFKTNFIIACKVSGYPKPVISWYADIGTVLRSEDALLEYPSVFISYATIENVTKNGTISCKCENSEGEDTLSMDLYVNRTFTFEVKEYPQDATFEFGEEGKLFCEVDAYPEASIKWYHNDSLIDSDNDEIIFEENMILIKNMTLDTTGDYKCEISNSVQTKSYIAIVDISGLESPEVKLDDTELVLKPGDWVNTKCTVIKGKPAPAVTWKFKTADDFEEIPEGVIAEETSLKIPSIKTEHMGTYKCEAVNIVGSDSGEVSIKVEYAPKIKVNEEIKVVKEDDQVELSCEVDAVPKARVRWEIMKDDVIVPLDSRHYTDEWNTHRFTAQSNDSGHYNCIAENDVGKAERTITVNVLVEPYIEAPRLNFISVRSGDTVTLPCIVSHGNPEPSTKWEFIALNSTVTTISRGKPPNILTLRNISKRHEGSYICLAENEAGSDTIKVIVKVF
ncbi:unnamed protein product [Parnassius apollo]|uniref:(apollo) hypothetical protein n=1 Tax=Parnassius apollo TaxID=110799 RepID=A0A8S3Y997_PARAO|nr:unnamed protein product [Parnassius apollo]